MGDQYTGLDVTESEIYKLESFATINSLNLPSESHDKSWAHSALWGKVGC